MSDTHTNSSDKKIKIDFYEGIAISQRKQDAESTESKENKSASTSGIFWGLLFFVIGGIGAFVAFDNGSTFFGIIAAVFAFFGFAAIFATIDSKKNAKKASKAKVACDKEMETFLNALKDGRCQFPEQEFYDTCKEQNIQNLDSSFYQKKAKLIAEDMCKTTGYPMNSCQQYITMVKLKEYFFNCESKEKKEKARQEAALIAKDKKERAGHPAVLPEKEQEIFSFNNSLASLNGLKKREKYLCSELEKAKERLVELQKDLNETMESAKLAKNPNMYYKEKNWGVLGGIADGIAGPGAGAVVALNTMNQNEQNRKEAAKTYLSVSALFNKREDQLEKEVIKQTELVNSLQEEIHQLNLHIVFSEISQTDIFSHISICNVLPHKNTEIPGNEFFSVDMTISANYSPNGIPKEVKYVIDGTLKAEFKCDNRIVGTAIVPLPKYGITCDGTTKALFGICNNYAKTDDIISINVKSNKLWVMEA